MTGYEAQMYRDLSAIRRALERIATAVESVEETPLEPEPNNDNAGPQPGFCNKPGGAFLRCARRAGHEGSCRS